MILINEDRIVLTADSCGRRISGAVGDVMNLCNTLLMHVRVNNNNIIRTGDLRWSRVVLDLSSSRMVRTRVYNYDIIEERYDWNLAVCITNSNFYIRLTIPRYTTINHGWREEQLDENDRQIQANLSQSQVRCDRRHKWNQTKVSKTEVSYIPIYIMCVIIIIILNYLF